MIDQLPAFKNERKLIYKNGFTDNIITGLNNSFLQASKDVCKFAENFRGANTLESAFNLWDYIRKNVKYQRDPDGLQIIKMPGALIRNGNTLGGDCKSMSLCISSALNCLGAKNVRLRYVSFLADKIPTHVYTVFDYNGKTIPVDSVIEKFNYEKPYTFKIDYPMNLYRLSGVYDKKTLLKSLQLQQRNSLCNFLIRKKLSVIDGNTTPIRITEDQKNKYKNYLINHIAWHKKNNKFGLCYDLKIDELNDLNNNDLKIAIYNIAYLGAAEIGKKPKGLFKKLSDAAKKVARAGKKVSLAAPRNSFLLMVKLNVENIARRLKALPEDKLAKIWESLGGKYSNLKKEIEKGSQKKKIGDVDDFPTLGDANTIEGDPATASIVASAAAVLCAFLPLLGKSKTAKKPKTNPDGSPFLDDKGQPVYEDEPTDNKGFFDKLKDKLPGFIEKFKETKEILDFNEDGTTSLKKDVEITDKRTGFNIDPKILLIGGAGLAAILLISRKK